MKNIVCSHCGESFERTCSITMDVGLDHKRRFRKHYIECPFCGSMMETSEEFIDKGKEVESDELFEFS